jgi:hypothetical protein
VQAVLVGGKSGRETMQRLMSAAVLLAMALAEGIATAHAVHFSADEVLDGCMRLAQTGSVTSFHSQLCDTVMGATLDLAHNTLHLKYADTCVPKGITRREAARVTAAYIMKHPEKRHEELWALAYTALQENWPCRVR